MKIQTPDISGFFKLDRNNVRTFLFSILGLLAVIITAPKCNPNAVAKVETNLLELQ